MQKKRPISAYTLTILIALGAGYVSFKGLDHLKVVYANNSIYLLTQIIGQDLLTLFLGIPLLLITALMAARSSGRGYLVWLGTLSYFVGTYFGYAVGIIYNQFYLCYVVLFSFSLFALIRGLVALDIETFCLRFSMKAPVKMNAIFIILVGLALGWYWLEQIIPPLIYGEKLSLLQMLGTNSLVNQMVDLGIFSPLALVAGVWIWKRKPWGYILTVILLVKGLTMGLAFLITQGVIYLNGRVIFMNEVTIWGIITLLILVMLITLLRNLREETIHSYHDRISI